MAHRWGMILGSVCALLVAVGPVWAMPTHDYDVGWGKGGFHDKHDYEYGNHGKLTSHHKNDYDLDKKWWGKLEKHNDWGKGHGKYDPDCDPPVATPEPATLLLLGSTLAGIGVYARRRRQPTVVESC